MLKGEQEWFDNEMPIEAAHLQVLNLTDSTAEGTLSGYIPMKFPSLTAS